MEGVKELYFENYKILMKEIEEDIPPATAFSPRASSQWLPGHVHPALLLPAPPLIRLQTRPPLGCHTRRAPTFAGAAPFTGNALPLGNHTVNSLLSFWSLLKSHSSGKPWHPQPLIPIPVNWLFRLGQSRPRYDTLYPSLVYVYCLLSISLCPHGT